MVKYRYISADREIIMECISEEALDSLSADSRVWVILDKGQPETYLLFPKNDKVRALWAFLKREDAEHLMYLLKTLAPEYRDIELFVEADLLNDIREGAREHQGEVCVMSPIDSMEFFKRYEELLGRYYGF